MARAAMEEEAEGTEAITSEGAAVKDERGSEFNYFYQRLRIHPQSRTANILTY
jgi:hypothetical protein